MEADAVEVRCQGRRLGSSQLEWLRGWVAEHTRWSRKRLSRELCVEWDWRNGKGQLKDFAARSLLEKLEARGLLILPPLQTQRSHRRPKADFPIAIDWPTESIGGPLSALEPLQWISPAAGGQEAARFRAYLQSYHCLGLRVVGENMPYLVRDWHGRDLACLLFGAPAWRTSARDQFLGWDQNQRVVGLRYLTNNSRYLILPWVKVAGLSSSLMSQVCRRLSRDWQVKYGHPIYLVETFVEAGRFAGTCYRAANWVRVGQTRGRGRQGPNLLAPTEPIKDVYLYPLTGDFRRQLLANP